MSASRRIAQLDQGGGQIRFLIAGAALVLASAALAAGQPRLQALVWIAPGHEAEALTRQPRTCLTPGLASQIAAGRALFYAPSLLGGQAARAGVSCASCHNNGRGNPHFFLDGVSSAPGTADVSSSFFSPARGNATFDPKPIPDLALPGKVSRDEANGDLERFTRGLIVEEFSGREPSTAVLGALSAYVRAIRDCGGGGEEPLRLAGQIELIRSGVEAAAEMGIRGDAEAAAVLISGARHQLGLAHERFAGPELSQQRRQLLAASRELQAIVQSPVSEPKPVRLWLLRFDAFVAPGLERAEPRSLYNEQVLARWLARR